MCYAVGPLVLRGIALRMLDRDMIASHRVREGNTAIVTALPVLELTQCYISWSCKTDASVVRFDVRSREGCEGSV